MASELNLNGADFQSKVLNSDIPVLVDFWAEWCGPCKAIGPSIEALASEYAGKAAVYKVDVDQNSDIASNFGVASIPALLIFKGGKVVDQMIGSGPKNAIAALIDRNL